jgi:hypothetical protein
MTGVPGWGVPPNMPPPSPTSAIPAAAPTFMPPVPPSAMPPPVPGTGALGQLPYGAPVQIRGSQLGVYTPPDKDLGIAYLLWLLLGFLGVHHFYLGKVGRGLWYLFTFGFLTLGLWVDVFTLPRQVRRVNTERRAGLR